MKKLFVVGDSTVAEFHDPYLYPRYGYGTMLHHYFKNLENIRASFHKFAQNISSEGVLKAL